MFALRPAVGVTEAIGTFHVAICTIGPRVGRYCQATLSLSVPEITPVLELMDSPGTNTSAVFCADSTGKEFYTCSGSFSGPISCVNSC